MRETRWQCTHFRAKKPCVIGTFLHEIGVSNIPILPSTKIGLKCVHRTFRNTLTAFHFSAIIQTCRRKPRLTLDERLHSSFFHFRKDEFQLWRDKIPIESQEETHQQFRHSAARNRIHRKVYFAGYPCLLWKQGRAERICQVERRMSEGKEDSKQMTERDTCYFAQHVSLFR